MKKFVKNVLCTPILICLFLVGVFFGVPALAKVAQINEFAVAVGVGIDKSEDENFAYGVSFLLFIPIPDQTFTENYKVFNAQGNSISETVNQVGLYIGKKLRFAHIKTIVIGENVLDENVVEMLDYFVRENDITSSTKVVSTNGKALDFLKIAEKIDSKMTTKISEIVSHNSDDLLGIESSLENLYNGYLSPEKTSLIANLKVENDFGLSEIDGGKESGGEEKGDEKKIYNDGETIVLKEGKQVAVMSGDLTKALNLFLGRFETGFLTVKDVPFGEVESDISFEVFGGRSSAKVFFENGVPVFELFLDIELETVEIETRNESFLKESKMVILSDNQKKFVEYFVKKCLQSLVEFEKENKVDLTNFYCYFSNCDNTKFEKFLNSLDDKDDYIGNILIKTKVNLKFR